MNLRPCFLTRFLRDRRGVAAIEAAIYLPALLAILLGFFDLYHFLMITQRIERTAASTADLVARNPGGTSGLTNNNSLTNTTDIATFFAAAQQLAYPITDLTSAGRVIITYVTNVSGTPTIQWQCFGPYKTVNTNLSSQIGSTGGTPTLPTGLPMGVGDGTIAVEVYYAFNPFSISKGFVSSSLSSPTTIYKRFFYRPRLLGVIAMTPAPPC